MTRWFLMVLAAAVLVTLGCGGEKGGNDAGGTEMRKVDGDGTAGLSAADQELARAQKVCPVSGEPLGSMGTPVKMTHGGRTFFLCCESCRKPFLRDPEKYLANLK